MAHRHVEILIGRLITDEAFRVAFLRDPRTALEAFAESGHELTQVEVAAITAVGSELWGQIAERFDPRLLKAASG